MALDLSKLNFFSRLDARQRVFVLAAGVAATIFLIYLLAHYLSSGNEAIGPSRVASAPAGLQSVPGGALTAEYSKALQQANAQAAKKAQMTGGSAVPTLINYGGQVAATPGSCVVCSDQSVNIKDNLDAWVRQGKVSPEVATMLQSLADKNVPVGDFEGQLNQLVKDGKLTPMQARELLQQYKKQHDNVLLQESSAAMDAMIKSGQLPLDVANQLLDAQKNKVPVSEYAAQLRALTSAGKIKPEVAQKLLSQYVQQQAKEAANEGIASLHQLARDGQITPDIEKELVDLQTKQVPVDTYAATLQRMVKDGKIIPAVADKLLADYKAQREGVSISGRNIARLVATAEKAAYDEIADLLKTGKMTQDVADKLRGLISQNIPFADYAKVITQLVSAGQMTPDIAKLKVGDYQQVSGLREMAIKLDDLQSNNATNEEYADELKKDVQAGLISPEQAAQLMQDYQAATTKVALPTAAGATTDAFAALQQSVQNAQVTQTQQTLPTAAEFNEAQSVNVQQLDQNAQARIEAIQAAMAGQAATLVNSAWQPTPMNYREGIPPEEPKAKKEGGAAGSEESSTGTSSSSTFGGRPLIKAGTILFAVLDTTVNSDYADSPVMATIVDGPLKGSKLLGKLVTTKSVSGQLDRVSLNFTLMNMDAWPKSKTVTAYAIDPDTAKTALASQVDNHYLLRFGAIMGTAFLQGYGSAITQVGSSTVSVFGTSTTTPALSASQKIFAALGKMGQVLGDATSNYVNTPPTVKVDAGVSLGILFMSDVT